MLRLKPSGDDDLTEVLFWVFTRAVERPGTGPEDRPAQVVWVSPDHRIEEVDGGGLGPQEFVRPVEILPRLRDGPLGVVVEMLVQVPADDVLRLEGFDLVDCLSPGPEAAADHTLREIHVTAVVDHVPRDNQPEVGDVQNTSVAAVGVADFHDHEVVPFEREAVVRDRDRRDRRWRDTYVYFIPKKWPCGDAFVHLRYRSRRGDNTSPKTFCQQPSGEPVIAVTVGDEDVRHVSTLLSDPVTEHVRLIRRHPGVRQHRILPPVD